MTTSSTRGDHDHRIVPHDGPRAQAPIRWPHPDRPTLALLGVWVFGLVVALLVAGLIVPPSSTTAEPARVWAAFGGTVVGCAIMIATSFAAYRRSHEGGVLVLGLVPAFSCIIGGLILAASKLT